MTTIIIIMITMIITLYTIFLMHIIKGKTRYGPFRFILPFYNSILQVLDRSYIFFNLTFNAPPKAHAFVSSPLKSYFLRIPFSKINLKSFTKHLTIVNILTGIIVFIIFFLLRIFVFPEVYYVIKVTFWDSYSLDFSINKDLFLGILTVIIRFSIKGFIEDLFDVFLPQKLPIGDEKLPLFMAQDSNKKLEGGDTRESILKKMEEKYLDQAYTDAIKLEYSKFISEMEKIAKSLKDRQEMYNLGKVIIDHPEIPKLLRMQLQDQTQFFNASLRARMELVKITLPSLPLEIKAELSIIENEIFRLQKNQTDNIDKIRNILDEKQQVKEFFDLFNAYRNKVRKEIIKYETLSHKGIRDSLPNVYNLKEFKQLVNIDAPKAIKGVVDQDNYLKSKISEIINVKKQ